MAQKIAICDAAQNIVGWTDTAPGTDRGGNLRHSEAERLLGGPVKGLLITVTGGNAEIAGAPVALRDNWHCFALMRDDSAPAPDAAERWEAAAVAGDARSHRAGQRRAALFRRS